MANTIQDKSKAFAIRIIRCYKFLTEQKQERIMSKQLLRCGRIRVRARMLKAVWTS